jgi:hypothetical protein
LLSVALDKLNVVQSELALALPCLFQKGFGQVEPDDLADALGEEQRDEPRPTRNL